MSSILLSGLTTITTFTIFGDGWDNIGDILDDVKKLFCWIHQSLPKNKFLRIVIYGFGSLVVLRSLPFVLRRTSFFAYFDQQMTYFHRGNNHKEILEFKSELLSELKENDHNLPLFNDEKLVILELNIGGGTNLSYYPRDSYVIGTDVLEESKEMFEDNFLFDEEHGILRDNRFIHTIPEELNNVPDNTVSCVVSFHALCSAKNVYRALSEIQRVLMPGGKLYFIEHISCEKRFTKMWLTQLNFRPTLLLVGCCIKSTELYIDEAGFSEVSYKKHEISHRNLPGPLKALVPHVYGYAKK